MRQWLLWHLSGLCIGILDFFEGIFYVVFPKIEPLKIPVGETTPAPRKKKLKLYGEDKSKRVVRTITTDEKVLIDPEQVYLVWLDSGGSSVSCPPIGLAYVVCQRDFSYTVTFELHYLPRFALYPEINVQKIKNGLWDSELISLNLSRKPNKISRPV